MWFALFLFTFYVYVRAGEDSHDGLDTCTSLGCLAEQLGNCVCDPACDFAECEYDRGDCGRTEAGNPCTARGCLPCMINDGTCNAECNHPDCQLDGFDCDPCYNSGCPDQSLLGNNQCNTDCWSEECQRDGGDCNFCYTRHLRSIDNARWVCSGSGSSDTTVTDPAEDSEVVTFPVNTRCTVQCDTDYVRVEQNGNDSLCLGAFEQWNPTYPARCVHQCYHFTQCRTLAAVGNGFCDTECDNQYCSQDDQECAGGKPEAPTLLKCTNVVWPQFVWRGSLYRVTPGEFPRDEAEAYATRMGGTLAVFETKTEAEMATFYVQSSAYGKVSWNRKMWIGLKRSNETQQFSWVNGAPLQYTRWDGGQPRDQLAVIMGTHGEWTTLDAADGDYFGLIEKKLEPGDDNPECIFVPEELTAGRDNCVGDLWTFNGHTYRYTTARVNYADAEREAKDIFGGYLANIETKEEMNFVWNTILAGGRQNEDLWGGATNLCHSDTWTWLPTKRSMNYSNWWQTTYKNSYSLVINGPAQNGYLNKRGKWTVTRGHTKRYFGLVEIDAVDSDGTGLSSAVGGCRCRRCTVSNACQVGYCNIATGSCATKNVPDGTPCDDGNRKTIQDHCVSGQCTPGTRPVWQCAAIGDPHYWSSQWDGWVHKQKPLQGRKSLGTIDGVEVSTVTFPCASVASCNSEVHVTLPNSEQLSVTLDNWHQAPVSNSGLVTVRTITPTGLSPTGKCTNTDVQYLISYSRQRIHISRFYLSQLNVWWMNVQWYLAAGAAPAEMIGLCGNPPPEGDDICEAVHTDIKTAANQCCKPLQKNQDIYEACRQDYCALEQCTNDSYEEVDDTTGCTTDCGGGGKTPPKEDPPQNDEDQDGNTKEDGDCDDTDASVFQGAFEQCNGKDDDCDGIIDNRSPPCNVCPQLPRTTGLLQSPFSLFVLDSIIAQSSSNANTNNTVNRAVWTLGRAELAVETTNINSDLLVCGTLSTVPQSGSALHVVGSVTATTIEGNVSSSTGDVTTGADLAACAPSSAIEASWEYLTTITDSLCDPTTFNLEEGPVVEGLHNPTRRDVARLFVGPTSDTSSVLIFDVTVNELFLSAAMIVSLDGNQGRHGIIMNVVGDGSTTTDGVVNRSRHLDITVFAAFNLTITWNFCDVPRIEFNNGTPWEGNILATGSNVRLNGGVSIVGQIVAEAIELRGGNQITVLTDNRVPDIMNCMNGSIPGDTPPGGTVRRVCIPDIPCNDGDPSTLDDWCNAEGTKCEGIKVSLKCHSIGDPHMFSSYWGANKDGAWVNIHMVGEELLADIGGVRVHADMWECAGAFPTCNRKIRVETPDGLDVYMAVESFRQGVYHTDSNQLLPLPYRGTDNDTTTTRVHRVEDGFTTGYRIHIAAAGVVVTVKYGWWWQLGLTFLDLFINSETKPAEGIDGLCGRTPPTPPPSPCQQPGSEALKNAAEECCGKWLQYCDDGGVYSSCKADFCALKACIDYTAVAAASGSCQLRSFSQECNCGETNPWAFNIFVSNQLGDADEPFPADFQGTIGIGGRTVLRGFSVNWAGREWNDGWEYSVLARGDVSFTDGTINNGGLFVQRGDISLTGNVIIEGDIYSQGNLYISEGSLVEGNAIVGTIDQEAVDPSVNRGRDDTDLDADDEGELDDGNTASPYTAVEGTVETGNVISPDDVLDFACMKAYFEELSASGSTGGLPVRSYAVSVGVLTITIPRGGQWSWTTTPDEFNDVWKIRVVANSATANVATVTLFINILGQSVKLNGKIWEFQGNISPSHVMINLPEALEVGVSGAGHQGVLLAPSATVQLHVGSIWTGGTIVARNLFGSGQVRNSELWTGDTCQLDCLPNKWRSNDNYDGDGFLCYDDCDDYNDAVFPEGDELCDDNVDNDCDGVVNDGCDNDADTYTVPLDCDDGNADVSPAAVEVCDDGIDNDCDFYIDGQDPSCGGTPTGGNASPCPPDVGCADGRRAGLTNLNHWPNIAVCSGRWSGSIESRSAGSVCAPGWHVCSGGGTDASLLDTVTYQVASGFEGCFAFDSTQNCGQCASSCVLGSTDEGSCRSADVQTAFMAGMGKDCGEGSLKPEGGGCLNGRGRIDASFASSLDGGCGFQQNKHSGVVCCRNEPTHCNTNNEPSPPTARCISELLILTMPSDGQLLLSAALIDAGSSDQATSISRQVTPDKIASQGVYLATLTVTNAYGLKDTCEATIKVNRQRDDTTGGSNLGEAEDWAAFILDGISWDGCPVQVRNGGVASGNTVEFKQFDIAGDMVVCGDIVSADLGSIVHPEFTLHVTREIVRDIQSPTPFTHCPINWDAWEEYLRGVATSLGGMPNTAGATVSLVDGVLVLTATHSTYNIFDVNVPTASWANVAIDCPVGSTVVINLLGSSYIWDTEVKAYGVDSSRDSGLEDYLLWNFPNANTVTFKGYFRGTILAPRADVAIHLDAQSLQPVVPPETCTTVVCSASRFQSCRSVQPYDYTSVAENDSPWKIAHVSTTQGEVEGNPFKEFVYTVEYNGGACNPANSACTNLNHWGIHLCACNHDLLYSKDGSNFLRTTIVDDDTTGISGAVWESNPIQRTTDTTQTYRLRVYADDISLIETGEVVYAAKFGSRVTRHKIDGPVILQSKSCPSSGVREDECLAGTHMCDVNAMCRDTEASYTCTCRSGYSTNGSSEGRQTQQGTNWSPLVLDWSTRPIFDNWENYHGADKKPQAEAPAANYQSARTQTLRNVANSGVDVTFSFLPGANEVVGCSPFVEPACYPSWNRFEIGHFSQYNSNNQPEEELVIFYSARSSGPATLRLEFSQKVRNVGFGVRDVDKNDPPSRRESTGAQQSNTREMLTFQVGQISYDTNGQKNYWYLPNSNPSVLLGNTGDNGNHEPIGTKGFMGVEGEPNNLHEADVGVEFNQVLQFIDINFDATWTEGTIPDMIDVALDNLGFEATPWQRGCIPNAPQAKDGIVGITKQSKWSMQGEATPPVQRKYPVPTNYIPNIGQSVISRRLSTEGDVAITYKWNNVVFIGTLPDVDTTSGVLQPIQAEPALQCSQNAVCGVYISGNLPTNNYIAVTDDNGVPCGDTIVDLGDTTLIQNNIWGVHLVQRVGHTWIYKLTAAPDNDARLKRWQLQLCGCGDVVVTGLGPATDGTASWRGDYFPDGTTFTVTVLSNTVAQGAMYYLMEGDNNRFVVGTINGPVCTSAATDNVVSNTIVDNRLPVTTLNEFEILVEFANGQTANYDLEIFGRQDQILSDRFFFGLSSESFVRAVVNVKWNNQEITGSPMAVWLGGTPVGCGLVVPDNGRSYCISGSLKDGNDVCTCKQALQCVSQQCTKTVLCAEFDGQMEENGGTVNVLGECGSGSDAVKKIVFANGEHRLRSAEGATLPTTLNIPPSQNVDATIDNLALELYGTSHIQTQTTLELCNGSTITVHSGAELDVSTILAIKQCPQDAASVHKWKVQQSTTTPTTSFVTEVDSVVNVFGTQLFSLPVNSAGTFVIGNGGYMSWGRGGSMTGTVSFTGQTGTWSVEGPTTISGVVTQSITTTTGAVGIQGRATITTSGTENRIVQLWCLTESCLTGCGSWGSVTIANGQSIAVRHSCTDSRTFSGTLTLQQGAAIQVHDFGATTDQSSIIQGQSCNIEGTTTILIRSHSITDINNLASRTVLLTCSQLFPGGDLRLEVDPSLSNAALLKQFLSLVVEGNSIVLSYAPGTPATTTVPATPGGTAGAPSISSPGGGGGNVVVIDPTDDDGSDTSAVVGIVIGVIGTLLVVAIIVGAVIWCMKHRQGRATGSPGTGAQKQASGGEPFGKNEAQPLAGEYQKYDGSDMDTPPEHNIVDQTSEGEVHYHIPMEGETGSPTAPAPTPATGGGGGHYGFSDPGSPFQQPASRTTSFPKSATMKSQ